MGQIGGIGEPLKSQLTTSLACKMCNQKNTLCWVILKSDYQVNAKWWEKRDVGDICELDFLLIQIFQWHDRFTQCVSIRNLTAVLDETH